MDNLLGIYEKALPIDISWKERLELAKKLGFDFVEISIDEKDFRLERLYNGSEKEIKKAIDETGVTINSMCFSGHRRFPLGSHDEKVREKALELMQKAIDFSLKVGIRVIQLAGYDVYYEDSDDFTVKEFKKNLGKCIKMAEQKQVMLAMEIMDTPFLNSITKYMEYDRLYNSPWFCVYPDIGNLTAWDNDVKKEIDLGISKIVAIHLKDTLAPCGDFAGQFKCVPFGAGCVDFAECFKILKAHNYAGPYMIEMWSGENSNTPEKEILEAKEWLLDQYKIACS